jgi:hypothetical protein
MEHKGSLLSSEEPASDYYPQQDASTHVNTQSKTIHGKKLIEIIYCTTIKLTL